MSPQANKPSTRRPGRPAGEASGAGRAALLAAARRLIGQQGLAALTSKAVAEEAGVRPTLVNYYFGDRDGLLHALVAEISSDLRSVLQRVARQAGSPEVRLGAVIEAMLRKFADEPYAARLFFEQVLFADDAALDDFADGYGRSSNEAVRSVIEQGVREGLFGDADIDMAVATICGICIFFGAATPLIQRVMKIEPLTSESAPRLARRASSLILNGLMGPARDV